MQANVHSCSRPWSCLEDTAWCGSVSWIFNTHLEHDNGAKVSKRQEDDQFLAIVLYSGMKDKASDLVS